MPNTIPFASLNIEDVIPQETETDIFNRNLADLQSRDDHYSIVETDPSYNVLGTVSYSEYIKTQEYNDRVKDLFLGHSKDTALDFIGVTYHRTPRLIIDAGDPNATPPIEPTYEDNDDYTARILLSGDAYSTAGSKRGYIYHAKSADGNVKDISIASPSPGTVDVVVLSRIGDGAPDAALLTAVTYGLSDDVRPLTDQVVVQAAAILTYLVDATLTLYPGFNSETIRAESQASFDKWKDEQHSLGRDITELGIRQALKVGGVHNVVLNATGGALTADLIVTGYQAAYCTGSTVTVGGFGE